MDLNTTLIAIAAVVVLAVLVIAFLMSQKRRSDALKEQFGPEYRRAVDEYGDQRRAEQELAARRKRVQALDLRALTPQERDHFREDWRSIQGEFVDAPEKAVTDANRLVQQVMQARGYPVGDFEQRAADISVEHAGVVTHYRTAHEIAQRNQEGKATTEDLRQAMVHYRALSEDLLQTAEPEERVKELA